MHVHVLCACMYVCVHARNACVMSMCTYVGHVIYACICSMHACMCMRRMDACAYALCMHACACALCMYVCMCPCTECMSCLCART
jgi:hypothetical protein